MAAQLLLTKESKKVRAPSREPESNFETQVERLQCRVDALDARMMELEKSLATQINSLPTPDSAKDIETVQSQKRPYDPMLYSDDENPVKRPVKVKLPSHAATPDVNYLCTEDKYRCPLTDSSKPCALFTRTDNMKRHLSTHFDLRDPRDRHGAGWCKHCRHFCANLKEFHHHAQICTRDPRFPRGV
ncbi:hypothetical protein DICA4_B00562 [Diutina catenulata]